MHQPAQRGARGRGKAAAASFRQGPRRDVEDTGAGNRGDETSSGQEQPEIRFDHPILVTKPVAIARPLVQSPLVQPIRRKITLAFTPPKPNPLEMAFCIGIGRALPATMSIPSAPGSGFSRLSVGGAIWSRKARTVKIAASPPAAPSRWPVAD